MSVLVLAICLLAILQRKGARSIAVPIAAAAAATISLVWGVVSVLRNLEVIRGTIQGVAPSDKATILAASISEGFNCLAFDCVAWIPLGVAAYLVDRWLVRKSRA
jgi:hypothetical protein